MKTSICSPCGILGYGFPEDSFNKALNFNLDAIVVDAGSTDAGPHKLGKGVAIVSRTALKKDLWLILNACRNKGIPCLIGSAGGAGAKVHVEWTLDVIAEICSEIAWNPKVQVIWADISKKEVKKALAENRIEKMSPNVPDIDDLSLAETNGIVAQMGHEPIVEALKLKADIVVCGRAFDPAPFAAVCIAKGQDKGLAYHMGKILECGALCCDPGTAKDCIVGTLYDNHFVIESVNPKRRCTPVSIAAHTFYEKDHPYLLKGPGMKLDLSNCHYRALSEYAVEVKGSRYMEEPYTIKLEGARRVAFRTFVIAGIRDPLLISCIDEVEEDIVKGLKEYYKDIDPNSYKVNFYHYGINAVMGDLETNKSLPHEVGLLFEVVADTQDLANTLCATLRSSYLHYGYEGRKATAGNLAFPFAPSDIPFGEVYEFSFYHIMHIKNPLEFFRVERWYANGKA